MTSILHDLAIARSAPHAGEPAAGLRACERLLARDLPPLVEREARICKTWVVPAAADLFPSMRTFRIEESLCADRPEGWTIFNPSCLIFGDELLVLVRSSNYHIVEGQYVVPPADVPADGGAPWIRTVNLLARFGMNPAGDLRPLGEAVRLYGPDYATRDEIHITGLEDLRLRRGPSGGITVSGTCLDTANQPTAPNGAPMARIATARLLPDAGVLTHFECLPEPFQGRYEKNWAPIESNMCSDNRPVWLYSAWEEGRVATVARFGNKPGNHAWIVGSRSESPFALRHLRGRSQLIETHGGSRLLGIFGEAFDDGRRMYDHRFVEFSLDLHPLRWSPPFRLGPQRGVEFVAGLQRRHGTFIISYGLRDEEAWLATLPVASVEATLTDIPC
jgi:hypothetical protein